MVISNQTTAEEEMNSSMEDKKIRISVIGASKVGKSALTVRYLTKRFIGEYNSSIDMVYHQTLPGNPNLDLEIVDISTPTSLGVSTQISTDGTILVYSITDRDSFQFAKDALSTLISSTNGILPPVVLVANKSDLREHRTVAKGEGQNLGNAFGIQFFELSVADNSPEVTQSFTLVVNALTKPPKRRFSSVAKMLRRLGKISLTQKQSSDSSSESSFEGNLPPYRTSPKLWNFANSRRMSAIDCP